MKKGHHSEVKRAGSNAASSRSRQWLLLGAAFCLLGMLPPGGAEAASRYSGSLSLSATSLIQNREKAAGLAPIKLDVSRFSFTLPNHSAAESRATERSFVFTPSGKAGKGVSVALSAARATPPRVSSAPVELVANAPQAYNIDMSLAYGRFAVNGGLHQERPGTVGIPAAPNSGMDFGFSYGTQKWRTSVQASADSAQQSRLTPDQGRYDRYAVEAGGALLLSPRLSVGGGVRYRMAPEHPTLLDSDRDDRAVFVGGRFAF